MIEPEPIRLKERIDALASDELAELHAYTNERPSPALQQQMLAALEAQAGSWGAPTKTIHSVGWRAFHVLALSAALLASFVFWAVTRKTEPTVSRPAPPAPLAAPKLDPTVARGPVTTAPSPLPELKPPARPQPTRKAARPAVDETPQGASDPLAELKLLARARRVLPSRAEAALALSEEHAQLYPRGALAEEREVLAIEALLKLERVVEAERRAHAFLRAFPDSSQRPRLSLWLTQRADKP